MYGMKRKWLALKHNTTWFVIITVALALSVAAEELTPEEKGLQIAQKAFDSERGFGDSSSDLIMILRTAAGQEARRELRIRSLELSESESRTMVVFDSPQDVRGTALLTHTFTDKDDDQWLYLPAVGRVRRIAGGSRSGPFMGSEFSFEDMSAQRVEKFTYKYLGEEECDGMRCHMLERYPEERNSGYSRQVAWLDTEHLRVIKVDYYDRRGDLLKTLTAKDYQQHKDKFWRPGKMEMRNHQTNRSTGLEWQNYSFGNGFTERDFDQNALRSAR